jgi:hypothetical protein
VVTQEVTLYVSFSHEKLYLSLPSAAVGAALSSLSQYQKLANSYDFIFPDAREHSPEIWHREAYREGKH